MMLRAVPPLMRPTFTRVEPPETREMACRLRVAVAAAWRSRPARENDFDGKHGRHEQTTTPAARRYGLLARTIHELHGVSLDS
jgi:hypothetical protein